ncbi:RadC family protein [Neisseria animalis]|uniref:JAB domain-containing protein n=1 Tax=Neisseria animalis TaxID=492 RepID=A0A5P3MNX6_NEIAN|nr:DNA repair protein RadC [Neisseria animalis]QEY23198.1 JAB domain-containing protein [Neisseria animalis]ROW31772.1 JAB domain-containing protein [Neisseria animalis]VEE08363.1 DNA repair protein RadC [Neisseria animalis]
MSIKHWPEGERPREKLLERGAGVLSDAELLAILLRVGTRGMSAVDLARYLLNEFGSLGRLMSAEARVLSRYKGMGTASFTQFAVVKEIGRRILSEELQQGVVLNNPRAVADYLRLHLGHEKVEVSTALLLNSQNQLIGAKELSRGTVAENTVYIREVVKLALEEYASAVIIAHNHPGGTAMPSENDILFTRRLQRALDLVEIDLLDHFIITANESCSMRGGGWLDGMPSE